MTKQNKKKTNIYKVAGKLGKGVKKYGSYVLTSAVTLLITKSPDIIKKINNSMLQE